MALLNNVDLIYAEYPFLEKLFPRKKIEGGRVERWSKDILKAGAFHGDGRNNADASLYGIDRRSRLYLLDERGKVITQVGRFDWFFFLFSGYQEDVGQTLARIKGDARQVRYAFEFRYVMREFTLYKLPHGFENAADWLNSEIEKDRQSTPEH